MLSDTSCVNVQSSDVRIRASRIRIHLLSLEPESESSSKTLNPDSNPNLDSDSHITGSEHIRTSLTLYCMEVP